MSEINGNSFEYTMNDRFFDVYRYMHTGSKIFKRWRNQFTVSHDSRYADEMDVLNVAISQIIKYLPILCSFRLCIHSNEIQLRLGSVTLTICMRECVRVFFYEVSFHRIYWISKLQNCTHHTHTLSNTFDTITLIDHSVCYCDHIVLHLNVVFSIVQRCVFICVFDHSIQMTCELDLR